MLQIETLIEQTLVLPVKQMVADLNVNTGLQDVMPAWVAILHGAILPNLKASVPIAIIVSGFLVFAGMVIFGLAWPIQLSMVVGTVICVIYRTYSIASAKTAKKNLWIIRTLQLLSATLAGLGLSSSLGFSLKGKVSFSKIFTGDPTGLPDFEIGEANTLAMCLSFFGAIVLGLGLIAALMFPRITNAEK